FSTIRCTTFWKEKFSAAVGFAAYCPAFNPVIVASSVRVLFLITALAPSRKIRVPASYSPSLVSYHCTGYSSSFSSKTTVMVISLCTLLTGKFLQHFRSFRSRRKRKQSLRRFHFWGLQ